MNNKCACFLFKKQCILGNKLMASKFIKHFCCKWVKLKKGIILNSIIFPAIELHKPQKKSTLALVLIHVLPLMQNQL